MMLWENVRFLKEHHVTGLLEEGNFQSPSGEFEELRGYLLAKLLWDPDMEQETYEALMDEFLKDYYGRGWRHIREYIDETSARAAENHLHIYNEPEEILPPEDETAGNGQTFAQRMTRLWEMAFCAADTEEQKRHVRKSRIQNEYYLLYTDFDHQKERNQGLWESLQEFGITRHREAYPLPQLRNGTVSPRLWSEHAKRQTKERKEKENAGNS